MLRVSAKFTHCLICLWGVLGNYQQDLVQEISAPFHIQDSQIALFAGP